LNCLHGELLHDTGEIAASMDAYQAALRLARNDSERVPAWVGLASCMRMADRYDEALDILDLAEAAASVHELDLELARIHHLRGNLYFPAAKIEACREQHGLALDFARKARSVENEARALGGLGDACYAQGRMRSAHEHFHHCLELCEANGLGRIEVANRPMAVLTRLFVDPLDEVVDAALTAIQAATRVAHERAEVIGQICLIFALLDRDELDRAKAHCARLEVLIQHLGARRFAAARLTYLGKIACSQDRRSSGLNLLREALRVSRETGDRFFGPRVLGAIAAATDDSGEREQALKDGEEILHSGAMGANHPWFYRDAMEAALRIGDWNRVEGYASALEDFTRPEPLPWTDFFIARGRTLAALGRGERDEKTISELKRLRDEARRVGLHAATPELDHALAVGLAT
jgi:tetratricopeptide (TPR) repeat protein